MWVDKSWRNHMARDVDTVDGRPPAQVTHLDDQTVAYSDIREKAWGSSPIENRPALKNEIELLRATAEANQQRGEKRSTTNEKVCLLHGLSE
jgi:hypothetical protein